MGNRTDGRFVAIAEDGVDLQAWSYGAGPETLLLVSGLGGTGGFWKDVAPALADGRRVLCFDQRGIGASARGEAHVNIDLLARDCLAVLDAAGAEHCVLLGHSTGGCIGQRFATIVPGRATGLILSAAWLRPGRYMTALFEARRAILTALPETYAAIAALFSHPPAWLEENWHVFESTVSKAPAAPDTARIVRERIDALLSFDGSADAASLDLPALVVGTRDDMIVPFFLQEILAAALPSAEMAVLDSGGHFFPLTRPAGFVEQVAKWMANR